ncbi:hypothetical protein [Nonomuraea typhae]|uniref:hypothetical protein n=1 Tax=Nonomuraea typhae TaxID=2603600 RepID=UPI0012FC44C8|nr:hypothetical protein [Nonomuraea typhae]
MDDDHRVWPPEAPRRTPRSGDGGESGEAQGKPYEPFAKRRTAPYESFRTHPYEQPSGARGMPFGAPPQETLRTGQGPKAPVQDSNAPSQEPYAPGQGPNAPGQESYALGRDDRYASFGTSPRDEPGVDDDQPWNPELRRTAARGAERVPWESLPPSARHYGTPARPRTVRRVRRWAGPLLALVVAGGLVLGLATVVFRFTASRPVEGRLVDAAARVTIVLPTGWREGSLAPVTGFTSVARSGNGLVMARAVPEPGKGARVAATEAAHLYSRLLLKGDTVDVVDDRVMPNGHTRALMAEYRDVVNRPAYLRVTLLTRPGRPVLLVGLLQPADTASIQALDAVMASVR